MRSGAAGGVILLGAWLLISPRLDSSGTKVDEAAPLTQWTEVSAHDTIQECSMAKDALVATASGENFDPNDLRKRTVLRSRCIPTEHLYPPKPGGPR
jgi:hypothetical protein